MLEDLNLDNTEDKDHPDELTEYEWAEYCSTIPSPYDCQYCRHYKDRTLPMTPQVRDVLLKQKQLQQEHRSILERAYYLNDYVCTFDNGKEISPNYLSRTFHKIIVKTDLPSIRFHDLRHSVASNLLNDGFNAVQVAEWLGHSSSTVP